MPEVDRAGGADERHHRAAPSGDGPSHSPPTLAASAVALDVQQPYVAETRAQRRIDLVAVAKPIDQPCLERLRRCERRVVDDLADGGRVETASCRDVRHDRLGGRLGEPARHLPPGVGHLAAEKRVGRGLVLVTLRELRLDAQPVERVPNEHGPRDHPGEADIAARLQPDLLERRGQVVADVADAELAEALRPGNRDLPGSAKPRNGVAQLAREGEADRPLRDMRDETRDVPVALRLPERGQ